MTPQALIDAYQQGQRDFSSVNIDGAYFSCLCAPGKILPGGVALDDINLTNASLRPGSNPPGSPERRCCFANVSLRYGTFTGADCYGCDFRRANLTGADFTGADLTMANLRNVNLTGADLTGADFSAKVSGGGWCHAAQLRGAKLAGATLANADLSYHLLWCCDLRGTDLFAVSFAHADLTGAIRLLTDTAIPPPGPIPVPLWTLVPTWAEVRQRHLAYWTARRKQRTASPHYWRRLPTAAPGPPIDLDAGERYIARFL